MSAKIERAGVANPPQEAQAAKTVVARQGETIGDLAARHGVDAGELAQANPHVSGMGRLKGGTELRLPEHRLPTQAMAPVVPKWSDAYEAARQPTIFDHTAQSGARGAGDGGRQARDFTIARHGPGAGSRELMFREAPAARSAGQDGRGIADEPRTSVQDPLHITDAVRQLDSDGDKITVSLGMSASVEGGKLEGQLANVEITRVEEAGQPPKYVLSMDSGLAVGLYGELGSKLAGSDVQGQIMLGGSIKVEQTFDSPEEVARAIELLGKECESSMIMDQLKATRPPEGLSPDEIAFLQQHPMAIEYKGQMASEIAASWGLGPGELGVSGNLSKETSLRIEFPPLDEEGKFTGNLKVTVDQETAVGGGINLGQGVTEKQTGTDGKETESGIKHPVGGGNVEAKIVTSFSFELPPETPKNLLEDPMKTLKQLPVDLGEVAQSTTVSIKGEGDAFGKGGGAEVQFKIEGALDQETRDHALTQLLEGDTNEFFKELGDDVTFEYRAETYSTQSKQFSPEISIQGYGAGIEAQYSREDHGNVRTGQMTGTQMYEELQRLFSTQGGRR
ncbi:MAG: LysM peptidoglycan-binding domain-containing protein [Acidobacteria bacterium]|nr:LysM peptidoglycan-binding domain-containing protein [Acidobacteriota bacterium]